MILSELVAATILEATGEVSTSTEGDDDWDKILGFANVHIPVWAAEPGVNWRSLYSVVSLDALVTATASFALKSTIRKVSTQKGDFVRILHTNGTTYSDYELVPPERLYEYSTGSYCAIEGGNLVFNAAFTSSSPQYGGTIKVPSYLYASTLAAAADVVPVDNPQWLVLMCAGSYVFNDYTRAQNYPTFVARANDLMNSMKLANQAQSTSVYRGQASTPNGATW